MNLRHKPHLPNPMLVTLVGLFIVMLVVFLAVINNLQRAMSFTGTQITGFAFAEYQRQIEVLEEVVARHQPAATAPTDLATIETELEVLQTQALMVRNDALYNRLDAKSRWSLDEALNQTDKLNLEHLITIKASEFDEIADGARAGFRGAIQSINLTRGKLFETFKLLTVVHGVMMTLLGLTIALVIWQFNRALKLETARTQDAEQAREALERVAATLRETETVLKRERDFGVLVMGAMGQGLSVTNADGVFEYVNPAYARLLAMDPDDLIGHSPFELVPNEDHAAMAQGGNERQTGWLTVREHQLRRHDGSMVPALVTAVPRFEDGRMIGTIAVITDLTESKHNETRLRQLHDIASAHTLGPEQRLKALLRLGMDAFGLETSLLAQVRHDARHMLEDGPDLAPFGFENRQIALEATHWLAQDGSAVGDLELELARVVIHASRPVMWRDHIGVPVQVQGQLYGCLSFSRRAVTMPQQTGIDQTGINQTPFNTYDEEFLKLLGQWLGHELERIESEGRLRERTEQLHAVIDVSPDGFLIMNQDGHITDLNPALLEMTGLERESLVGATDVHFDIILQWLADPTERFSSAREANEQQSDMLQILRPNPRILKRTMRAMRNEAGLEVGRVMYFRDITHETEVSRMKSEFLSIAAHELRTPMASIYGFSELLLNRNFDETVRLDLIETIHRQAGRLVNLLNELLDLARIEARAGKDFHIIEHDLAVLVQSTLEVFVPADQQHRLELDLHSLASVTAVPLDGEKFQQAFGNVISNAFKYSEYGPVNVRLVTDAAQIERIGVRVQDRGIGMLPHETVRAFERFFRADTSGKTPGTGLGLSLVKEIVELHGGTVELESAIGRGTCMTLWFPRLKPQPVGAPGLQPSRTTNASLEVSNR